MSAEPSFATDRVLTEGPVTRSLLAFAIPTMAANLLQTTNASINAMWVGQLIGKQGLAAASNVNLIVSLVHSLTFGFGMAVTILIARTMGAGELAPMRRTFAAGLGLFCAAGIVFAVAGVFTIPHVLRLLGVPPDTHALAHEYALVSFAGLPAGLALAFLLLALRGTGDSRTPLLFIVPTVFIDIALNPVLILGLGPLPRLDIAGSALASLIATCAGLILLVAYVYVRDLPIRLRGAELRYVVTSTRRMAVIVCQGWPMGLQMIVTSIAAVAMMGLVNGEGTATVAGYAAVIHLWGYVQMPAMGLGGAASMMAAQNIGGGRWDRVDRIARAAAALGFGISLALVLLIITLDRQALGLFFDVHSAATPIARHINLCATWSLVLYGALLPLVVIPRANGANLAPLIIMTVMFIPGRLGFAYLLRPFWGGDAIWWSFPVSHVLAGVLIVGYYCHGGWRGLNGLTQKRTELSTYRQLRERANATH